MKKNQGFTLIELLAVIVILALIALIATPIIMNVINDAKSGAAKDAMYSYVKAVELASTAAIDENRLPSGTYQTSNGNLKKDGETVKINFKGMKPKDGGKIVLNYGTVTSATLEFNGFQVVYNGKEASVKGPSEPAKTYKIGEEVYFDPTGAVSDCASGKEWTVTNTATTCYKWNIVKDNGDSIEMLLDHNTTAKIGWNMSNTTTNGPKEVYNQLKVDTASWSNVETLSSSDNVTRNNSSGGTYTIDYSGMKARIMSGQEVADIIGNHTWNQTGAYVSIAVAPWLKQNLSQTNSETEPIGYWLDTSRTANSAWRIYYGSNLHYLQVNSAGGHGVRPVVRVLKCNIEV